MKTIIAATDFSIAAEHAVSYAADLAVSTGADLLLVHIWKLPVNYDGMVSPVLTDDLMEDAKHNMSVLKKKLSVKSKRKIKILSKIATGDFFVELEKICGAIKPYVIVLGSQGTTAAERAVFGGHTVYAMKHLSWPVIAVPPGITFSSIKNIGIACDLKKVEEVIPVREVVQLVKYFHANLHILNTGKEGDFDADIVFQSGVLKEMLADLKPVYHFITDDNVDKGIMDFAEKNKMDLLIVFPKRHGLIDKLMHRSHTKQLVLHSHVPVMTLHAH